MAGRRIVYRFRKQHRAGAAGTLGNKLVIESSGVIYSARTDRIDDGTSRSELCIALEPSVSQGVIGGGGAHQRKRCTTTEAWLTAGRGNELFRYRHIKIF